jgi:hypothetical protein
MVITIAVALLVAAAPVVLLLATLAVLGSFVAGLADTTADGWLFRRPA